MEPTVLLTPIRSNETSMELLICRKFVDKNFPLLHINKVELLGQPLILAFMVILGEGAGREELFESFFSVNLPDILE